MHIVQFWLGNMSCLHNLYILIRQPHEQDIIATSKQLRSLFCCRQCPLDMLQFLLTRVTRTLAAVKSVTLVLHGSSWQSHKGKGEINKQAQGNQQTNKKRETNRKVSERQITRTKTIKPVKILKGVQVPAEDGGANL